MSESDARFLDAFPGWLRTLPEDAVLLAAVVADQGAPESLRRPLAAALNYLFKSLDLIPDGIEDLGFLDDAFILRVAASFTDGGGAPEIVTRLGAEAVLIGEFLGPDYPNLERYTRTLGTGAVRGRSVEQIVNETAAAAALEGDVKGWASSYVVPSFNRDAKNLVKLKAFFAARLSS